MRRAAKVDSTAPALVKRARELGALYLPLNGDVDGVLQFRGRTVLVDWKSPKGHLTPKQGRLVAMGWQIAFVSSENQLDELLGVK